MSLKFLDENNRGDTASAIQAVNYATMMRSRHAADIRVLNASWGTGSPNALLRDTIQDAGKAGISFVAASGNGNVLGQGVDNDFTPFFPASYELDNVLSVGASDDRDRLAGFSNFGLESVDLVAPGVGILSTLSTLIPMELNRWPNIGRSPERAWPLHTFRGDRTHLFGFPECLLGAGPSRDPRYRRSNGRFA